MWRETKQKGKADRHTEATAPQARWEEHRPWRLLTLVHRLNGATPSQTISHRGTRRPAQQDAPFLLAEFSLKEQCTLFERSKAEEDKGTDGWMASQMQWTWTWANPGRWWGTGRPAVPGTGLQSHTRLGNWTTTTVYTVPWLKTSETSILFWCRFHTLFQ